MVKWNNLSFHVSPANCHQPTQRITTHQDILSPSIALQVANGRGRVCSRTKRLAPARSISILNDLKQPHLTCLPASRSLYNFSAAHAVPAICYSVFSPHMMTTLHRGRTCPTSLSRNVSSKASPSGMPSSSPLEPWIGSGHEMASSAAGLIAPSVVGHAQGAVRYSSGVVERECVLRARSECVYYVEIQE